MTFSSQLFALSLLILLLSCESKDKNPNDTIEVFEEFSELQSIIDSEKENVLVINFWATSCAQCLKEMPHFGELEKNFENNDLKVLLVSLDRARTLVSRVYPFVKKYKILPEVVVLEDQNYSAWTEKIDTTWYGALPATIILRDESRKFRFGAYTSYEELVFDVKEIMDN